jgi:Rrf2 family protein
MQLSTTSKYAIKILGLMAQSKNKKYSSKTLSKELKIPYQYLAKIMTKLTKNNLISSTQGKYGGFSIAKSINSIKIIDIISIFDDINIEKCILTNDECNIEQICIMHEQWQKPKCAVDNFFANTTLYNLVENSKMVQAFNYNVSHETL